ncbi:MAG: nucleotidyltransferase family protein [Parcubacteria group bacterium]|nr:nucleotidyltransferase family protein [Parcubacteria group bacterium]
MNKEDVIKIIENNMPHLKEQFCVKDIGLFGSFARGEHTDTSDIDILVEFESPIGFFDFIRLETFLSNALQRRVDLVTKRAIKASIKEETLKETFYV